MKIFVKNLRVGDVYKVDATMITVLTVVFLENNKIMIKWTEKYRGRKYTYSYEYADQALWNVDKKIDSEFDILDYI